MKVPVHTRRVISTPMCAVYNTSSETIYIATKVRTEVWGERKETNVSTLVCTDMAAVNEMFANNKGLSYVVTNLATGEKRTFDGNEIREWLATQTLDAMVNYRIAFAVEWDRASLHGRGEITHEVYFTPAMRSDMPKEIP